MPSLNILIEGNADYVLLNMLRVHPKQLNEKGMGKERIIEKVKKHGQRKFSDIYVGLVDADKPNTDISSEYLEFKEVKSNNGITLFKKDSNQYLIELCCPALEKWLLNSAESVTINLADYNLPNDVKELKDIFTKEITRYSRKKDRYLYR